MAAAVEGGGGGERERRKGGAAAAVGVGEEAAVGVVEGDGSVSELESAGGGKEA